MSQKERLLFKSYSFIFFCSCSGGSYIIFHLVLNKIVWTQLQWQHRVVGPYDFNVVCIYKELYHYRNILTQNVFFFSSEALKYMIISRIWPWNQCRTCELEIGTYFKSYYQFTLNIGSDINILFIYAVAVSVSEGHCHSTHHPGV